MLRVRQSFARPRVADVPGATRGALASAGLPIKRGDRVAVGAGSRGIANIDVIVKATVAWLKELGARPFVFPAMGTSRRVYTRSVRRISLRVLRSGSVPRTRRVELLR